jgi:putative oxidoreductase
MQMSFAPPTIARGAPVPLRLIVGYGFLTHGVLKLERGVDVFVAALAGLGIPAPDLMAWTTIVIEIVGGLAVLAGAYVPLVSAPMAAVLLVAMVKVHWQFGFSSIKFLAVTAAGPQFGKPGIECDLLYLACLATLILGGSGPLAIDGWRRRLRTRPPVSAAHTTGYETVAVRSGIRRDSRG